MATKFYVRFIETELSGGGTVAVAGDTLFPLTDLSTDIGFVNLSTVNVPVLNAATFSTLDRALDPTLLDLLSTGISLAEVDVIGYDETTGLLASALSLGNVEVKSLQVAGDVTHVSLNAIAIREQQVQAD